MTTWSFRDALEELKARGHFNELVLWSTLGLHLGDIHFAEIQTPIKIFTFLRFVEQGSFNGNNLPLDGYNHTTAILLAFIPNTCLMDIECMVIGNMIRRCGSPLGDISSIPVVMDSIHLVLASEHKKGLLKCWAYMMLIGNYGRHMAFATDPPYCIAYAADYNNTNDPSKMTPCEPLNHAYAMVTSNMVVRRLLSVPNWEPPERKLTVGGCLLILRGVHFDPELFPDLVILCNHAGPLVDSAMQQEVPFQTIGPFWATDLIFPSLPGDLELFMAEEVAKLKELEVLNPPNMPGCLPLFPLLVSSCWGKVVSATLGTPPPNLDAHGIGQSLVTDQDEESILSDSYLDPHSNTVDSSTMWGRHTMHSSEREQKLRTTECQDRDGYKSSDKDHDRNHDRECEKSKRSDNWHGSDWPCGWSPGCKDHDGECSINGKCEKLCGHNSPSDSCKTKQRCRVSTSPLCSSKNLHTHGHRPLPPPPMFHSTPLATPCRLSSDPTSAHLSFNQSQSSLHPLNLGGGKPCPISSASTPIQAGVSSVAGPITLSSVSVSALNLTADHTKQIFSLACEGQHLKEQVAREFTRLSSQEVLFHTQAQSTGHEMLASGCPDRLKCTTQYCGPRRNLRKQKTRLWKDSLTRWVRHGYEQMCHYSSTYWIMRRSWTHFWTKLGAG